MDEVLTIVLLDGDEAELDRYGKLCWVVGEQNGYNLKIKVFSNTQSFLFEMRDSVFMHTTDIIIIDPETGGDATATAIRGMGYKGVLLYLTSKADFRRMSLDAFDAEVQNLMLKGEPHLPRFKKTFEQAIGKAEDIQRDSILLKSKGDCIRLSLRDIHYFAALDHFITAYYKGGEFEFRATMAELEERLSQYGFIRVSNSHLAAIAYIMNIKYETLKLMDGTELPVGRKYAPQLQSIAEHLDVLEVNPTGTTDIKALPS